MNDLKAEFEHRLGELRYCLPTVPVFSNHGLFHLANDTAQRCYEYHHQNVDRIFEDLIKDASVQIFEKGRAPIPPLTPRQRDFLKEKLDNYLKSIIGYHEKTEFPDWKLSGDRSYDLSKMFSVHIHALQRNRENAWKTLSDLSDILQKIKKEEESQLSMQSRTESERQEISQIRLERDKILQDLDSVNRAIGDLEAEKRNLEIRQRRTRDNRARLELELQDAITNDSKATLAIRLANLVKSYRNETRRRHRTEIEDRLNSRFVELFSGHRHIDRLTVDDDFVIRARDVRGADISVIGVSHGMRQLMATALLWSITEQSRYNMPVFIDTPLARLDRDNQRRLLEKYYPETSDQVILLATDSELDERKLSLIRNRTSCIYRIDNREGDAASFTQEVAG